MLNGPTLSLAPRIAVVVKGYPRLSETFVAQELRSLERAGLSLLIVSLRAPTDSQRHPVHDEIRARVLYLPEYLRDAPGRVLRGILAALVRPGLWPALATFGRDLRRDRSRNRWRRFGQALVLAAELPTPVTMLYAHFLHTPASVARYAAAVRRLPWAVSAHAKDIWTSPAWELRDKLGSCAWAVTCTRSNHQYLRGLSPHPEGLRLLYHGIDLQRFAAWPRSPEGRDGRDPTAPVRLLSVGRAVPKKGYPDLLEALAGLPEDLNWRLHHVGSGPLADGLRRQAAALGLSERICWAGSQPQTAVLQAYRQADLFVLPCRIEPDGDRDGLPNVLLEAQSQGLACVATRVSGIPELIVDGTNGLLVEPRDPPRLGHALERLIRDPGLRYALGQAGRQRVQRDFDHRRCVGQLRELLLP